MTNDGEEGAARQDAIASRRRLRVTLAFALLGVGVLLYGLFARWWPAALAGLVLIVVFGRAAAGARRQRTTTPILREETEWEDRPASAAPRERDRFRR